MHFSTGTYLCSVFSLLALQPTSFASPASSPFQAITYRTSANRACHRGTYNSPSSCTINCGSGPSAGNCTKLTTLLVNDSPPYDCTCPGDPTALLDNDQSQSQSPSSSSSTSVQNLQPPLLRKTRPRRLSAQSLQLQARATQQQQQKRIVEKAALKEKEHQQQPRAALLHSTTTTTTAKTPPCHRGYHKNMDTCMANCGTKSGRCINYVHVDGQTAVACQCKPEEL